MKLIAAIIALCVFTITSSIRVPSTWPRKQNRIRTIRPAGSETAFQTRPYVHLNNYNKINSGRKKTFYNNVRHPNLKKDFSNDWTPIFPPHLKNPNQYHPVLHKNYREPINEQTLEIHKNYRADKTHEYQAQPINEQTLEIPTRPIYPGEGKWAKRGRKYQPFISQHKFTALEDESNEEKPDGHEIFEENQQFFENFRDNFKQSLHELPQKSEIGAFSEEGDKADFRQKNKVSESAEESGSSEEDGEKAEFVPMRLYAQIRRSESEEHLPKDPTDERLKEVVKDSKIQTVYTEEGYEDSAYDHAGHEKNAEQDEGFAEFDKEIEKEKKPKEETDYDSVPEGTQYNEKPKMEKIKMTKDNFIKTEETKTTQVKDKDGSAELEISSEIKILATPNNGTKTHKFVKIFPKVYKNLQSDTENNTISSSDAVADTLPEASAMKYVSKSFFKMERQKRFRRFINDLPEKEDKYPYYKDSDVNPDSPLRYSEDYRNIPKKLDDDLAFYNQADRIECPQVEDGVDPIPDRVKEAEDMEEAKDVEELVDKPRLGNLGDKIDCFKKRYFGENPLDSPIFEEQTIAPVKPIFNLFNTIKSVEEELTTQEAKVESSTEIDKARENSTDLDLDRSEMNETTTVSSPQEDGNNKTEIPSISIITTPKYTIDKTPKHIYDQIDLLQYLPSTLNSSRSGKSVAEESSISNSTDSPKSEALLIMRKRRRRIRPKKRPLYHVFDVNRFLPKNPYSYLDKSTELPRFNLINDANTKDQLNVFADVINNIKNSSRDAQTGESSNVISVKLNSLNYLYPKIKIPHRIVHIKNELSTTTMRPIVATVPRKITQNNAHRTNEHLYEDLLNTNSEDDQQQYENLELFKIGVKIPATTRKTTTTTTARTTTKTYEYIVDDDNVESPSEDGSLLLAEKPKVDVLGLVPPGVDRYKTIYNPKLVVTPIKEIKMNNFLVPGMKPPSLKQKVYIYSDFKLGGNNMKIKYQNHRRSKRSAQRQYSDVVRNRNKPIDVDDDEEEVKVAADDDDYVPHRPKNYHYDEETGKIVYDKKEEAADDDEEEYIVVTDAPIAKPTRKSKVTTPKFIEFTGPSFVDFIQKLKSDPKYQEIPDPTTTEKSADAVTTSTTTQTPLSTNPPEFLSILAKVRGESGYKAIEDPDDKKKKKTTTPQAPEDEPEEEIEETQVANVQNSPGGQSGGLNFQIFDINDYLPKVKNYTPRTSIDYSKYKTIERPSVRHNFSSRYNSDEEDLADVKTVRVPILMKSDDDKDNPMVSESKYEEIEPEEEATTTTTTTVASTTRRLRARTRATTPRAVASTDKPKRTYPRRRPTRIRLGARTTTTTELPEEDTTKILRRRHYTPSEVEARIVTPEESSNVTSRPGVIEPRSGDSLRSKILQRRHQVKREEVEEATTAAPVEEIDDSDQKPAIRNSKKIDDVQVFQKYDKTKKHGGNLKKESDYEESKKVHEVKRLTDVVPKPFAFYTDPKLPKNVNQLMDKIGEEVEVPEEVDVDKEEAEEENYDYEEEDKISTTKKPVYVKDPGKRLYYYAPI